MATVTADNDWYGRAALHAYTTNISDLTNAGTPFLALMADSYSPSRDTDDSWDDISADETSGVNYDAGGKEIQNVTVTSTDNVTTIDGDDVTWDDSTIDARYAVVYDAEPADDADKKLLFLIDFGELLQSDEGEFTVSWDAAGIGEIDAT